MHFWVLLVTRKVTTGKKDKAILAFSSKHLRISRKQLHVASAYVALLKILGGIFGCFSDYKRHNWKQG